MAMPRDGRNEMYFFATKKTCFASKANPQQFVNIAHQADVEKGRRSESIARDALKRAAEHAAIGHADDVAGDVEAPASVAKSNAGPAMSIGSTQRSHSRPLRERSLPARPRAISDRQIGRHRSLARDN